VFGDQAGYFGGRRRQHGWLRVRGDGTAVFLPELLMSSFVERPDGAHVQDLDAVPIFLLPCLAASGQRYHGSIAKSVRWAFWMAAGFAQRDGVVFRGVPWRNERESLMVRGEDDRDRDG